ncbi:MAG: C2 family cysteine protease [Chlorobiaceae bacterium]|jgi:Calpain family cysteine protease
MTTQYKPENVGVINPYALAEVILKKRVNWKRLSNPQKLLADTLGHPYEKLFDPIHGSPLYAGLELNQKTKAMTRMEPSVKVAGAVHASVEVGATAWIDPGDFFEEAAELTDPVQGALGDCYFIAALASVAWARPYVIADRTRATGTGQQQFVDMIEFFSGGKSVKVEVTELLPLVSPGNTFIYARSSEAGEIWPAIYEKAYAKWRTNAAGDQPNYDPIAGGDPVAALQQLTGLTPYYIGNSSLTADGIWQKIRASCISCKTFNPMVAWTYGTAPSPSVNYNSAHLVANHAYSILGWSYVNNQEYVILRNPWGSYEATLNVTGGTWTAWDQPYYGGAGWWRPISMSTNDGIFALRADTFKDYFAGFGWVKTPEAP